MDFEKYAEKLPSDYTYVLINYEKNYLEFRIKEVNDGESAMRWITKVNEVSKVTWRVNRTYPEAGKCNIFKLGMRCQHNTDRRATGAIHSKNTNCPATLQIQVKRYIEKSKSKYPDILSKDFPTIVIVKNSHNHEIESPDILKCRDLGEASKEKLRLLFHKGHTPSSALQCLKTDLMLEHGEDFYKIDGDGFYIPTISVASKLFQKEFVSKASSSDDLQEFRALVARIEQGYQNEPDIFVPAMKKMLKNARTTAATQGGLVSAMRTFGLYNSTGKKINGARHDNQRTDVKPNVNLLKKSLLAGKRKFSAASPDQNAKVPRELQPVIIEHLTVSHHIS